MTEEQLETLGEIIETCLNYKEYGRGGSLNMLSLPMRVDALSTGLSDVCNRIRALYLALGGEDVWQAAS